MFIKCLASAWPLLYKFKNGSNVLNKWFLDMVVYVFIAFHSSFLKRIQFLVISWVNFHNLRKWEFLICANSRKGFHLHITTVNILFYLTISRDRQIFKCIILPKPLLWYQEVGTIINSIFQLRKAKFRGNYLSKSAAGSERI